MRSGITSTHDRAIALAATLVIEAIVGTWIMGLRPPAPSARDEGTALLVEFIRRAAPAPRTPPRQQVTMLEPAPIGDAPPPAPRDRHVPARSPSTTSGRTVGAAERRTSPPTAAAPALDLHVPELRVAKRGFEARDPFARAPLLPAETTRFGRAWIPHGNAIEQAAFRSPAVALVTVFGGPPRRCSESERRLRRVNCLPLSGDEEERETLRRAVDP